jgi:hypothetical protein
MEIYHIIELFMLYHIIELFMLGFIATGVTRTWWLIKNKS